MLPGEIDLNGIHFSLAPNGQKNAVIARGQSIPLPAGNFNRVYILAAATAGDQNGTFQVDGKVEELKIQDWSGFLGQWDNRLWNTRREPAPPTDATGPSSGPEAKMHSVTEFSGQITPGFIKRTEVAWFSSHRHDAAGNNEPYSYSYLFAYPIEVPAGAKSLTLPRNEKIRILAITMANEPEHVQPAHPLYDNLDDASAGKSGGH
jgi:alpha-mannosidase